jgi:hypothetical protein
MVEIRISAATTDKLHHALGALAAKSNVLSAISTEDLIGELRERMAKHGLVVNVDPVPTFADYEAA